MALVKTEQIQNFMDLDPEGTGSLVRAKEVVKFDPSRNAQSYSPKYKERTNQTEVVMSRIDSFDIEIDLTTDGTLASGMLEIENALNTEVEICRVYMFHPATSPNTGYEAFDARFVLNLEPVYGESGEPIKLKGKATMSSDGWTTGTATIADDVATFVS